MTFNLFSVFLITSDIEVEPKCKGTLCDAYSNWRASIYLPPWTQRTDVELY